MPYRVRKQGKKYALVKKSDGKVVAEHDDEESAIAQMRAIYANERRQSQR